MSRKNSSNQLNIVLPVLPESVTGVEDADICVRFMRHLRNVPSSRMDIKILSAIQFTSDMLDYSDAHVSKALVDFGLRAPRMAFPADFLQFIDNMLMRSGWDLGGPSASILKLRDYWDEIGEERLVNFNDVDSMFNEGAFV